jgi:hypothetical protein
VSIKKTQALMSSSFRSNKRNWATTVYLLSSECSEKYMDGGKKINYVSQIKKAKRLVFLDNLVMYVKS